MAEKDITTPTDADLNRDEDTDNLTSKSGNVNQAAITGAVKAAKAKLSKQWEAKIPGLVQTAIDEWREENGFDEDAVAKLSTMDETQRKTKGLESRLGKAQKELDTLRSDRDRTKNMLRSTITKTAVLNASGDSCDPESVWLHLQHRLGMDSETNETIVLGSDGERDHGATVTQLVSDLLAERPNLAKTTGTPGSGHIPHKPDGPTGSGEFDLSTTAGRLAAWKKRMAD